MRKNIIFSHQSVIAVPLTISYNENREIYHTADTFAGVMLLRRECRSPLPAEISEQRTKYILGESK